MNDFFFDFFSSSFFDFSDDFFVTKNKIFCFLLSFFIIFAAGKKK